MRCSYEKLIDVCTSLKWHLVLITHCALTVCAVRRSRRPQDLKIPCQTCQYWCRFDCFKNTDNLAELNETRIQKRFTRLSRPYGPSGKYPALERRELERNVYYRLSDSLLMQSKTICDMTKRTCPGESCLYMIMIWEVAVETASKQTDRRSRIIEKLNVLPKFQKIWDSDLDSTDMVKHCIAQESLEVLLRQCIV